MIYKTLLSGLIVVANAGNILIYFPCISKSITFPLTAQVTELVKQGKELLDIWTLAIHIRCLVFKRRIQNLTDFRSMINILKLYFLSEYSTDIKVPKYDVQNKF